MVRIALYKNTDTSQLINSCQSDSLREFGGLTENIIPSLATIHDAGIDDFEILKSDDSGLLGKEYFYLKM